MQRAGVIGLGAMGSGLAKNLIAHGSTVEAAARSTGFDDPRMLRRLRARG